MKSRKERVEYYARGWRRLMKLRRAHLWVLARLQRVADYHAAFCEGFAARFSLLLENMRDPAMVEAMRIVVAEERDRFLNLIAENAVKTARSGDGKREGN